MKHFLLALAFFLCLPHLSFASVQLNEIMYDLKGSDNGLEWIEIKNVSDDPVDIASWYLYENETFHKLIPEGFEVLEGGDIAVIVQKIANHNASDVKLIKSSFSLKNDSETIALANEHKEIIDKKTYSSEEGASGNGFSLSRFDNNWLERDQSFGTKNLETRTEDENESDQSDNQNSGQETNGGDEKEESDGKDNSHRNKSDSPKKEGRPSSKEELSYYEPYVIFPDDIIAGNPTKLSIGTYFVRNKVRVNKRAGIYVINFGDGNHVIQEERFEGNYYYQKPGSYVLSFEYYRSKMSYEQGLEPDTSSIKYLEVIAPSVSVEQQDEEGDFIFTNNSSSFIDISNWHIASSQDKGQITQNSFLAPHANISIPYDKLRVSCLDERYPCSVWNEGGYLITQVLSSKKNKVSSKLNITKEGSFKTTQKSSTVTAQTKSSESASLSGANDAFFQKDEDGLPIRLGPNTLFLEDLQKSIAEEKAISNDTEPSDKQPPLVQETTPQKTSSNMTLIMSILGSILIVLAALSIVTYKYGKKRSLVNKNEDEIIDIQKQLRATKKQP